MTTNRIDHTNCEHPRTPAGRRACRAAGKKTGPVCTCGDGPGTVLIHSHTCPMKAVTLEASRVEAEKIAAAGRRRTARRDPITAAEERLERNTGNDWVAGLREVKNRRRTARRDPAVRVAKRRTADIRKAECVQAGLHVGGGRCACGWSGTGCTSCENPLYNVKVTGPNAGGMCGPSYCHYALAN